MALSVSKSLRVLVGDSGDVCYYGDPNPREHLSSRLPTKSSAIELAEDTTRLLTLISKKISAAITTVALS